MTQILKDGCAAMHQLLECHDVLSLLISLHVCDAVRSSSTREDL